MKLRKLVVVLLEWIGTDTMASSIDLGRDLLTLASKKRLAIRKCPWSLICLDYLVGFCQKTIFFVCLFNKPSQRTDNIWWKSFFTVEIGRCNKELSARVYEVGDVSWRVELPGGSNAET